MLFVLFIAVWAACTVAAPLGTKEILKPLPDGSHLGFATTNTGALRVRFLLNHKNYAPITSTMVPGSDSLDASFEETRSGIKGSAGSLSLSKDGVLSVLNPKGVVVTKSKPLGAAAPPKPDICSAQVMTNHCESP
jgi:hypothetical protein